MVYHPFILTNYILRLLKSEYGPSQDWFFGLKLLYLSLLHEEREEYKVCDFSCILSSTGGYVGLFFGISIFELLFSLEFILSIFCKISNIWSHLGK